MGVRASFGDASPATDANLSALQGRGALWLSQSISPNVGWLFAANKSNDEGEAILHDGVVEEPVDIASASCASMARVSGILGGPPLGTCIVGSSHGCRLSDDSLLGTLSQPEKGAEPPTSVGGREVRLSSLCRAAGMSLGTFALETPRGCVVGTDFGLSRDILVGTLSPTATGMETPCASVIG